MSAATKTILLVDSDERSRRLLDISLRQAGYAVESTDNADVAMSIAEDGGVDLVIYDFALQGLETILTFREERSWRHVPFFFIAASANTMEKVQALELGADEFLMKPLLLSDVMDRVRLAVARSEKQQSVVGAAGSGELSQQSLHEILHAVVATGRTGAVRLYHRSLTGTVYFQDGELIDAVCGRDVGEAAVQRLFTWHDGHYETKFVDRFERERRIHRPAAEVIGDGLLYADEWDEARRQVGSLDEVYHVEYRSFVGTLGPEAESINSLVRMFDGIRTLEEAIALADMSDVVALRVVKKLLDAEILQPAAPPKPVESDDLFDQLGESNAPAAALPMAAPALGRKEPAELKAWLTGETRAAVASDLVEREQASERRTREERLAREAEEERLMAQDRLDTQMRLAAEKARREVEERLAREAEEAARLEQEARRAAEETARLEAERRAAEAEAARKAAEAEAARKAAEAEAARKAAEEAARKAAEEAARKAAEEEAKRQAEARSREDADAAARRAAKEAESRAWESLELEAQSESGTLLELPKIDDKDDGSTLVSPRIDASRLAAELGGEDTATSTQSMVAFTDPAPAEPVSSERSTDVQIPALDLDKPSAKKPMPVVASAADAKAAEATETKAAGTSETEPADEAQAEPAPGDSMVKKVGDPHDAHLVQDFFGKDEDDLTDSLFAEPERSGPPALLIGIVAVIVIVIFALLLRKGPETETTEEPTEETVAEEEDTGPSPEELLAEQQEQARALAPELAEGVSDTAAMLAAEIFLLGPIPADGSGMGAPDGQLPDDAFVDVPGTGDDTAAVVEEPIVEEPVVEPEPEVEEPEPEETREEREARREREAAERAERDARRAEREAREAEERAEREAEEAREAASDDPEAACEEAFDSRDYRAAVEACRMAVDANSSSSDALTNLGRAYYELGDVREAEETLSRAVRVRRRNRSALLILGAARQELGDNSGAREAYETYLEYYGDSSQADEIRRVLESL